MILSSILILFIESETVYICFLLQFCCDKIISMLYTLVDFREVETTIQWHDVLTLNERHETQLIWLNVSYIWNYLGNWYNYDTYFYMLIHDSSLWIAKRPLRTSVNSQMIVVIEVRKATTFIKLIALLGWLPYDITIHKPVWIANQISVIMWSCLLIPKV